MIKLGEITDELQRLPQPFALMSSGVQGSGKTTILTQLASTVKAVLISPDELRTKITGNELDRDQDDVVWRQTFDQAEDSLRAGRSIMFDTTLRKPEYRAQIVNRFRTAGARSVVALRFNVDLTTAIERNANRSKRIPTTEITQTANMLKQHPISKNDGFDLILDIDVN